MANQKYTDEFREEAVRQVLDREYSVKDAESGLCSFLVDAG
jgi:transposase-like protein